MSKLSLIAPILPFLCMADATNSSLATGVKFYYENGVYRGDGVMIVLDLDKKIMLDVETVYHLRDCVKSSAKLCFTSNALTFSSEPAPGAISWAVNGLKFKVSGLCTSMLCEKMKMKLKVIHSSQRGNEIDFYYSDSCGLMGWSTTYPKEKGHVETFMQLPPKENPAAR